MKLKNKLMMSSYVIALIPLLIISLYSINNEKKTSYNSFISESTLKMERMFETTKVFFQNKRISINTIALNEYFKKASYGVEN